MLSDNMSHFRSYNFITYTSFLEKPLTPFIGFYLPPNGVLPYQEFIMDVYSNKHWRLTHIFCTKDSFIVELIVWDKYYNSNFIYAQTSRSFVEAVCDLYDLWSSTLIYQPIP